MKNTFSKIVISTLSLFLLLFSLQSCKDDPKENKISVAVKVEPPSLNPILGTGNAIARQIFTHHMFNLLVENDPNTGEEVPSLAKELPVITEITEGVNKGGVAYSYEILEDAVWDNNTPVTANDFVFSIKTILNPKVENLYASYYDFIKEIQIDPTNPKKFTLISTKTYILTKSAIHSILVMPEYLFDPKGIMKNYSIADLLDPKKKADIGKDAQLEAFATDFRNNFVRDGEKLAGSGPYKLNNWESGIKITLIKKPNHWTAKYTDKRASLTANSDVLEYKVYSSETAAFTDMKDGKVDVMCQATANDFLKLKADQAFTEKNQFFTPKTSYIVGINLNTRKPILADVKVREALSSLLNVEDIMKNIHLGMASPQKSIVSNSKEYYAAEIPDQKYDIEKAKQILAEAGWKDTNNNGILDKKVSGKTTELNLSFVCINKAPAPDVAQIFQNAAKQAGINVNIEVKDVKVIVEECKKGNFDLHYVASSQDGDLDDFNQKWSTKSPDNETGFGNAKTDQLIAQINSTLDKTKRNALYHDFQRIVNEQKPILIIDNPQERIIISKRIKNAKTSIIRPFVAEHLFKVN